LEFGADGTLTSFTPTSITVGDTSCFRDAQSPGSFGLRIGDLTQIVCRNGVLVGITPNLRYGVVRTQDSGSIATLTRTRLDRCALTQDSPGLAGFRLGELVSTLCVRVGGRFVLTGLAPGADPYLDFMLRMRPVSDRPGVAQRYPPLHSGTVGQIRELDRFVTVGTLRCSVGPSTPALFRFHVGERVTMVCDDGAVLRMRH
jgi:hypothetical protein